MTRQPQTPIPEQLAALIEKKDAEGTGMLIDIGVNVNLVYNGMSPLMKAAAANAVDVMRVLLKKGAVVDLQNDRGETALMLAVKNSTAEAVCLLLDAGADINKRTNFGETAFYQAVIGGTATIDGVYTGPAMLDLLLEKGADIDAKSGDGYTPLMIAATRSNMPFLKILLDKGADPRLEDNRGNSVLHWAFSSDEDEVVRLVEDAIEAFQRRAAEKAAREVRDAAREVTEAAHAVSARKQELLKAHAPRLKLGRRPQP